MGTMALSPLFRPITVGQMSLSHRVVLNPLTRIRADKNHVPSLPVVKEYYSQRGTTPGTLLITEATPISPWAGGYDHIPGIYNQDQIKAWKEVVESVHKKGSHIFLQLWAIGRQAMEKVLKAEDPSFSVVAPSPVPFKSGRGVVPRELTVPEIKQYLQAFADAAYNAIHEAGFDGVEIHGANGYLVDQFLQDVTNHRQDEYGGSIENRSRFGLEVARAIVGRLGTAQKVAIRLSPWSTFGEMGMDDPKPQFSHFVSNLKQEFPDLAYIHVVEPRVAGDSDNSDNTGDTRKPNIHDTNDFLRNIWSPRPYISAGGYDRESAIHQTEVWDNELIGFGRMYISNPDLPLRLKKDIALTPYERKTFYLAGDTSGKGYTDYPFASIQAGKM